MPVDIEPGTRMAHGAGSARQTGAALVIALINNMPDTAVHSTEAQFGGLLRAAAGTQSIRLRFSSFPELARAGEAREHIERTYWPLEAILADAPDAVIVTGTEPRAARLDQEPYWQRFIDFLAWAESHTLGSVWSCLAAHAAVLKLDGIERRRLAEKRCGVYPHSILVGHPLLKDVSAPMAMPHSRWNELSADALRTADYTLLSWSPETGADAFVRQRASLMLFFQGHPEYEDVTLLKEYRRDVGRYLNAQQPHYPTLPHGYLSPEGAATLGAFRERALADRQPALLESFPFAAVAGGLQNTWKASAVALYRNWLAFINAARTKTRAPETVSLP
jgi:homoserine O-succinyltransferase/O-acetyltransferase